MTESRRTLSLKLLSNKEERIEQSAEALRQAITHHMYVRSNYNRVLMQVVPMVFYRKHVDALVLEKHGTAPPEVNLAMFKLSGFFNVAVTVEPITAR
jgi:hypothetical protein